MPTTVCDNSLVNATGEIENLTRVVRWRPGYNAIHKVEENTFYAELNLKGKTFRSVDEMNTYIGSLVDNGRPIPRVKPETRLEKAMALVYQAVGAAKKKRIEKCREALAVYPHCADALIILSEYENNAKAKQEILRQAVEAGEQSLEDLGIDHDANRRPARRGHGDAGEDFLWAQPARPYLRARLALAQHLYETGDRDRAIEDYRSLMKLNPVDNQGVRYLLASALLEKDSSESVAEAAELVSRISDASPMWAWIKAFIQYAQRREGVSGGSGAAAVSGTSNTSCGSDASGALGGPHSPGAFLPVALTQAYYANPHIAEVLMGGLDIPGRLPDMSEYGSEEEAVIYGSLAARCWRAESGAIKWLANAVDEITGGLPLPSARNVSSVRGRITQLWRAHGRVPAKGKPEDWHYAKALRAHPEFGEVWFTADANGVESLVVSDVNPFEHVGIHVAVESILLGAAGEVRDAMTATLYAAMRAGLFRHEVIHLLGCIYTYEWMVAEGDASPLDLQALIARLRYVERLTSGEVAPDAILTTPARNDPCPCGSGRKFKKCCGRDDSWPIQPVVALARAIRLGNGKLRFHRDLETLSYLFGRGRYADIGELVELPPEHPLVILDNTVAVAEAMLSSGWQFHAEWALRDNIELARTLEDVRHLKTALYDAVNTLSRTPGFETHLCQCACELARMVEEPRESSRLWAIAGETFMTRGKMIEAGEATVRAVSVKNPHPKARLVRAKYLTEMGHSDAARAEYEGVVTACASSTDLEYQELAKDAREGIRKLGKRYTGPKVR